jgi:glutamate synthase (NADPH) small chain
MARQMLQFIRLNQKMPDKRPADQRNTDFDEISLAFKAAAAVEQSSRCEQCGVPFCQIGCPLGNNIPDWLMLAANDRMEEAYATSTATNTFPEICGRICPQDRLCEGVCVLEQSKHGAVTIGAVEKHITEHAFEQGWVKPPKPVAELVQSVGIIGGGPAGLAAADKLRRYGYQVVIYDRHDRMGGLLIYGIPAFKLEKSVVERRINLLKEGGVEFRTGVEIGKDISFAELRKRHDAILVATGAYKSRQLTLPGVGVKGVVQALSYLITSNKIGLGDKVESYEDGTHNAHGKNVVVIGGGDTAMDCVRTAIRQGAKSVKCLYRRDRANMPGSPREVTNAEEEGVEFVWMAAPEAVLGDATVTGIKAHRMHLSVADKSGRQIPVAIEGSSFTLPAELVITALGFDPEDIPSSFSQPGLAVTKWGTLTVDDRTKTMTSLDGVFAAGDIVRGPSLVVWAIRDGLESATAIDRYIRSKTAIKAGK